jgi:membrane-associated phospholipid phosphatase
LFDSAARDALRLDSAGSRRTARVLSDVLLTVSYAQPMLFDTFVVAWWQKQAPRVAWQMFVINTQAYALTFTLNAATKRLTSRARPWVANCDADPTRESCGTGGAYSAFYSGHAAMTATGAGLVCAHHTQLSLYRNNVLDTGSCLVAVAGTALTGAMRIAADNHWTSDVLVGHFMGYLSGYLLPTLMYYKEFRITPHDDPAPGGEAPVLAVLPVITDTSAQALVVGAW